MRINTKNKNFLVSAILYSIIFFGGGLLFCFFAWHVMPVAHANFLQFAFWAVIYLSSWIFVRFVAARFNCKRLMVYSICVPYVALIFSIFGIGLIPLAISKFWFLSGGALLIDICYEAVGRFIAVREK